MPSFGLIPALLSLATVLGPAACSPPSCDRKGQEPQIFKDGRTNASRTHYETSALDGTFLFFPSGRTYQLPHGLGRIPDDVQIYLAFVPNPDGGVAPSAGNQGELEGYDDEFVTVRNNSCAEFFVRVSAHAWPEDEGTSDQNQEASDPGATRMRRDAGR